MTGEFHHHPREAWENFRQAWNAGKGRQWTPAAPPDGWAERLSEDGWLEIATQAIGRIGECRYFKTPMTLIQFVKPGWAEKVIGGSFDHPKGDKPPPGKPWRETVRQAPYRAPKEVAALAAAVTLKEENL